MQLIASANQRHPVTVDAHDGRVIVRQNRSYIVMSPAESRELVTVIVDHLVDGHDLSPTVPQLISYANGTAERVDVPGRRQAYSTESR